MQGPHPRSQSNPTQPRDSVIKRFADVRRWWILPVIFGAALASCSGGGGGSATALPPSEVAPSQLGLPAVGTQWTYAQTVSGGASPSQSGTVAITYVGQTSYRGGVYYTLLSVATGAVVAPPLTSYFARGSDGEFRELAGAFYNFGLLPCASPQQEDVLASPTPFAMPTSTSVQETSYICGSAQLVSTATISLTSSGYQNINTPGGALQTAVVAGSFIQSGLRRTYTDYVFGSIVVRRDVTFIDPSRNTTTQSSISYASGPLDVAFPGPAMLLSANY